MRTYTIIGLFIFLIISGCGGNTEKQVLEPQILTPTDFAKLIKGEEVMLVDVRTSGEYQQGFIESAVNIDINGENFKTKIDHFDKDLPIAVYCAKGGRSGKASAILKELGFKEIYDLKGGYTEWVNQMPQ